MCMRMLESIVTQKNAAGIDALIINQLFDQKQQALRCALSSSETSHPDLTG